MFQQRGAKFGSANSIGYANPIEKKKITWFKVKRKEVAELYVSLCE
jgi:hypothetical protein